VLNFYHYSKGKSFLLTDCAVRNTRGKETLHEQLDYFGNFLQII